MINITAIMVANGLAITSLLTTAFCNRTMHSQRNDIRCVWIFLRCALVGCIIDPIMFLVDGRGGFLLHWINVIGNTSQYIATSWLSVLWIAFLDYHLYGSNLRNKRRIGYLSIVPAILSLLAIVNIFVPIVFVVDQNNVYSRLPLAMVYWGAFVSYALYGILEYYNYKKDTSKVRFFPIGVFLIPVSLGVVIQSFTYGVALLWPSLSIAISGLMMCLQTEAAIVDPLTGISNRNFLYSSKKYMEMSGAIIMDINSFKAINDTYGHDEGDQALILVAGVILEAISGVGFAIRYGGDEFLVFCRYGEDEILKGICSSINGGLEALGSTMDKPYKLSVSVGYSAFDSKSQSIDDLVKIIDARMYAEKVRYHERHPELARR